MNTKKPRTKLFSFVVNDDEKESLDELAEHLERTKSDAVGSLCATRQQVYGAVFRMARRCERMGIS